MNPSIPERPVGEDQESLYSRLEGFRGLWLVAMLLMHVAGEAGWNDVTGVRARMIGVRAAVGFRGGRELFELEVTERLRHRFMHAILVPESPILSAGPIFLTLPVNAQPSQDLHASSSI